MVYAQQHERSSNPSSMSPTHTHIVRPTLRGGETEQRASHEAHKRDFAADSAPSKTTGTGAKDDGQGRTPQREAPLPSTQLGQGPPDAGQSVAGPQAAQSVAVDEVAQDEELDHGAPSTGQGKKNAAMNKTQDQFKPRAKDSLLNEDGMGGNLLPADPDAAKAQEVTPPAPDSAEAAAAENPNKKKYSMVTDNNGARKPETGGPPLPKEAEPSPSSPEKRELSATTHNPSLLGNIRDPRYSQEMQKADQYKKKAKKRQVVPAGAAQKSPIKEEADQMNTPEQSVAQKTHVHLPKVPRVDESEAGEASQRGQSRSNSPEPLDSTIQQRSS